MSARSANINSLSSGIASTTHELVLYAADANGGRADPAFLAHTLPLSSFLTAVRHAWVPLPPLLDDLSKQSKSLGS